MNYSTYNKEESHYVQKINGRINAYEEPDPLAKFKMQEQYAQKNKATSYCDALNGTWEQSALSQSFFSSKNIQIVQNAIRANVYKLSGAVIQPPNIDNLKIVMRSIYLQYAQHVENTREELERLNKKVLDYAVPTLYEETKGYIKYLEDQSTIVVPIAHPLNHDRQYKQLELKEWV